LVRVGGFNKFSWMFYFWCISSVLPRNFVWVGSTYLVGCFIFGVSVAYCPGILFGAGGSTNSVDDREQRERGSGGGSPLVRGSTQFANE
jgi:hypothetical protein